MAFEDKKSKLNRFYLSEKYDEDRNISFNLKRAKIDELKNFKTFREGLEEFNRVAFQLEGDSRVWFHKDGAFRGSATPEKTEKIIERVLQENVTDEDAIEFINRENLVDVSPSKAKEETKEEVIVEETEEISVVDLEKEARSLDIFVVNKENKLAKNITTFDVSANTKYQVEIKSISSLEDSVTITYVLRDGDRESAEYTRTIGGFLSSSDDQSKIYRHYVSRTEYTKSSYWLLGLGILIEVICIILLVLRGFLKF